MTRKIPLIAHDLKRLYTGFLLAAVLLFAVCTYLTQFNPMVLAANGDAFWEFITEDFLPPALPKASRIPGIFSSVLVTLALAMSATTVAAILAFFVALFGSEKVSPFPRFAKVVRGFATFLRNIPALVRYCWGRYPAGLPGGLLHRARLCANQKEVLLSHRFLFSEEEPYEQTPHVAAERNRADPRSGHDRIPVCQRLGRPLRGGGGRGHSPLPDPA